MIIVLKRNIRKRYYYLKKKYLKYYFLKKYFAKWWKFTTKHCWLLHVEFYEFWFNVGEKVLFLKKNCENFQQNN
jgi:hypothetical protein